MVSMVNRSILLCSKRQENQTFSKADKDLTTSFIERQEHSCTVPVSVWKERVEYEVYLAANRSVLSLPLSISQERTGIFLVMGTQLTRMFLLAKWRTGKISQPDLSQMVCVRVKNAFEAEHSHIAQKMNQSFGSGSSAETAAPVMTNVVALASAPQSDKCPWLSVCARPYSTTWLSLSGTVTAQYEQWKQWKEALIFLDTQWSSQVSSSTTALRWLGRSQSGVLHSSTKKHSVHSKVLRFVVLTCVPPPHQTLTLLPGVRTCCLFSTIPHHPQKCSPHKQRQHLDPISSASLICDLCSNARGDRKPQHFWHASSVQSWAR